MSTDGINKLSPEQRQEAAQWLAEGLQSAPAAFRPVLTMMLKNLSADAKEQTFNTFSRQLARALGILPSSEKRKSGDPIGALKTKPTPKPRNEYERLELQRDRCDELVVRYNSFMQRHAETRDRVDERLKKMAKDGHDNQSVDFDIVFEQTQLSEEEKAKCRADARKVSERMASGDGADPAFGTVSESLMNANVVSMAEEHVDIDVDLPDGLSEDDVVKTMSQKRVRYDFSMAVTRLELDVQKKVVVDKDGNRRVICGSTSEFGPPRFSVTWGALATLAVMVGQFAMPLNRLARMLSTELKRFSTSSLCRMAHYVAERLLPVYLHLADEICESSVLAGDDTSCRVLEVASYFAKSSGTGKRAPPWAAFRTCEEAEQSHNLYLQMRDSVFSEREEGNRNAQKKVLYEPSLSLLVGREINFESARKDGTGGKQSLNTTVLTGRSVADDPKSMIVFYRSHLGSLGNLLEILLKRRDPKNRHLILQSDLSTTNLVSDPKLKQRFKIEHCGCMAHARRPFALYEEQDPANAPYMLGLFKGIALHELLLDEQGRNRQNVLAVRRTDSLPIWKKIREVAKAMTGKWSKATPLGTAARYIINHFSKLTAYIDNPQVEATNNLRERLLRTEKLIEKSSMFRKTIEGRAVLDILRTILQTAVAAGVPAQEYLVDIMRADPNEVATHPELYTPRAWAARKAA